MACCGKARAHQKRVAIRKATARAVHLNKIGRVAQPKPTKVKKNVPPKKVPPPTKTKPCTLCGKDKK